MLPITLGRDLSGTVESGGAGADEFRPGEAVYAMLGGIDRGSYAEYCDGQAERSRSKAND
jgi:NADPH:quinone reductase-like Zn-dependent oxidoreductase